MNSNNLCTTPLELIVKPSLPASFSWTRWIGEKELKYTTCMITGISAKLSSDEIGLIFTGEKTYDYKDDDYNIYVSYKLYDPDGYVVTTGTLVCGGLSVGDKFREKVHTIYGDFSSGGTYTLMLSDGN